MVRMGKPKGVLLSRSPHRRRPPRHHPRTTLLGPRIRIKSSVSTRGAAWSLNWPSNRIQSGSRVTVPRGHFIQVDATIPGPQNGSLFSLGWGHQGAATLKKLRNGYTYPGTAVGEARRLANGSADVSCGPISATSEPSSTQFHRDGAVLEKTGSRNPLFFNTQGSLSSGVFNWHMNCTMFREISPLPVEVAFGEFAFSWMRAGTPLGCFLLFLNELAGSDLFSPPSFRKRTTWVVKPLSKTFRFRRILEEFRCGYSGYKA